MDGMRALIELAEAAPPALAEAVDPMTSRRFRLWFTGSKVRDAEGKPLLVYHGTNRDFASFEERFLGDLTGHPISRLGFFFTDAEPSASRFATLGSGMTGANIRPCYLAIRRPWRIGTQNFISAFATGMKWGWHGAEDKVALVRDTLEGKGYDGIHVPGFGSGNPAYEFTGANWIAFWPYQIRSMFEVKPDPPKPDRPKPEARPSAG